MPGWDGLQEIAYTLKQNKLRTFLTAFGVFWGIFMLIILLGAGQGMRNGAEAGFSSDVRDSIWINPHNTSIPYRGLDRGRQIQFTEADMRALKRELPSVGLISAENPVGSFRRSDTLVSYQNRSSSFGVFGVADDYFQIKLYQDYTAGRRLNALDNRQSRKVAVIGTRVVERLFPSGVDPVGEHVVVNGVTFRVVGVFYDSGWEGRMSERVYIPLSTFQRTFGVGERISLIALQPKPGYDPFQLEEDAVRLLKERHTISPDDRRAIRAYNVARQSAQTEAMFSAINGFIWFVGLGTLMAGIVGISNIMIITVKERTREIGVRKALGATPNSIVGTLLLESVLVTTVAGYAGLVCGVALLELVNYSLEQAGLQLAYFQRPEVDFSIALTAMGLLIAVGALAGLVPAWQAARISPIEAMRAE